MLQRGEYQLHYKLVYIISVHDAFSQAQAREKGRGVIAGSTAGIGVVRTCRDGCCDGCCDGCDEGCDEGCELGFPDGWPLGFEDGCVEGRDVGCILGCPLG